MKKERNSGITVIALVITIVVMLLLAGTAAYSGIRVMKNANLTKFTAELKIVQSFVNQWYDELKPTNVEQNQEAYDNQFNQNILSKLQTAGITPVPANTSVKDSEILTQLQSKTLNTDYSNTRDFYILTKEDLEKLKVENIEQKVMINFKKRRVVSCTGGTQEDGTQIYTLEENNELYNVKYEPGV